MTSSAHPSDIDFGVGGSDLRRTFWLDELFAILPGKAAHDLKRTPQRTRCPYRSLLKMHRGWLQSRS